MSAFLPHELNRYKEQAERSGRASQRAEQRQHVDVVYLLGCYEHLLVKRNDHTISYLEIPNVPLATLHPKIIDMLKGVEREVGRALEPVFTGAGQDHLEELWEAKGGHLGMRRVKCPECEKEGRQSTVRLAGVMLTALLVDAYYDEEGQYHAHDPNRKSESFSCSNGHSWYEDSFGECWCGWKGRGT